MSVRELLTGVRECLYPRPKAKGGFSLNMRFDFVPKEWGTIETTATVLTKDGKQDAETHYRAHYSDSSAGWLSIEMERVFREAFLAVKEMEDGENEREDGETSEG